MSADDVALVYAADSAEPIPLEVAIERVACGAHSFDVPIYRSRERAVADGAPAALCLAGGGSSGVLFARLIERAAAHGVRAVAFDFPGHTPAGLLGSRTPHAARIRERDGTVRDRADARAADRAHDAALRRERSARGRRRAARALPGARARRGGGKAVFGPIARAPRRWAGARVDLVACAGDLVAPPGAMRAGAHWFEARGAHAALHVIEAPLPHMFMAFGRGAGPVAELLAAPA